jgi:hypothetical protein
MFSSARKIIGHDRQAGLALIAASGLPGEAQ